MATEDEIKEFHRSIAPDLDLANVALQYQDLQDCAEMPKADPFSMLQNMLQGARDEYSDVCVVLGRILACKPHSADCLPLRWMEEKNRRARESTKAGKQEWFSKVFANDDIEDGEVKEKELKRKF
eukprot:gene3754-15035_t